jgi:hypothetical protein
MVLRSRKTRNVSTTSKPINEHGKEMGIQRYESISEETCDQGSRLPKLGHNAKEGEKGIGCSVDALKRRAMVRSAGSGAVV